MGRLVLEKPSAATLLTAVEATLARLGALRLANGPQTRGSAATDPRELARLYGSVRRLRDLIRRSVGLFSRGQSVEVSEVDQNLLVQCLVHRIAELDAQEQAAERPLDRRLHAERRAALETLAEEIAIGPVTALPTEFAQRSVAAERLRARLARKSVSLSEVVQDRSENLVPDAPEAGVVAGASAFDLFSDVEPDSPVFEPDSIRDPRLRSALILDLEGLTVSRDRRDWRMAALHLMAVCEAVLIDFALPRARRLGLTGGPETWRLDQLAAACLEGLNRRDKALVSWLTRCDGLIHPGRQLRKPVVLNEQVFGELESGCRELLGRLPARA